MPPREDAPSPLWPAVFVMLGLALVAHATHSAAWLVAALAALGAAPVFWRLLTRKWKKGDLLKGLGAGLAASYAPLLITAVASLTRPECSTRACVDVIMASAGLVPWAGLAGMLVYWAFASPAPRS